MAEIETKEDTLKKRKPQARTVVGKKQMIEALNLNTGNPNKANRTLHWQISQRY